MKTVKELFVNHILYSNPKIKHGKNPNTYRVAIIL